MTYIYKKISKLDIMTLYYFQSSLNFFFYYTHEHHSLVFKKKLVDYVWVLQKSKSKCDHAESNAVLYIQANHVHSEEFCIAIYNN